MTGIYLDADNAGVPGSVATNGFEPHNDPSCPALFYPSTCDARITTDWLNAIISEIGQAVDGAGLPLDCARIDNLNKAIMTHGQTVGYCGADRTEAETQKGAPLEPGDYWLNTTNKTVYLVDAGGVDWALPNQPAAFVCCGTGRLWIRCGTDLQEIAISADDVTVDPCPSGPIDTTMSVQDAICALSANGGGGKAVVIYGGTYQAITNHPRDTTFQIDTLLVPAPFVSVVSPGVIRLDAGTYYLSTTVQYNDQDTLANRPIMYAIDPADTVIAYGSSVTGQDEGRTGNLDLVFTIAAQTDVRFRAQCLTYWSRGNTYFNLEKLA